MSDLSEKSSPDLGMSVHSTIGQNGHIIPPDHGQINGNEEVLPTGNWHLLSTSAKIKIEAAATADFEHFLKRVQGITQEWGSLCSGKNWKDRPSDRYFQIKVSMSPNSCIFLIPRETLTSMEESEG